VEHWSLTTLEEKLVKIGAKVVNHDRYVTSNWRKWWCRRTCSGIYCDGPMNGDHRPRPQAEPGEIQEMAMGDARADRPRSAQISSTPDAGTPKMHPIGPKCDPPFRYSVCSTTIGTGIGCHLG
jgi:hypothetical protein